MRLDLAVESIAPSEVARSPGRGVMLATMGVPVDHEAAGFALDTAVESGHPLVLANVTRLEPLPLSVRLGYDALEEFTPDVSVSLRRLAQAAASLGVQVERLRIRSPRPTSALLEFVTERDPGILVFGPDRGAMRARAYRRALARIRSSCVSFVWAPSGAGLAAP